MNEKWNDSKQVIKDASYCGDDDFRRVRRLLVETHAITPVGFNWEVRRWDGWRFYSSNPEWDPKRERTIRLWETEKGRLVGVVHPEGSGDAHIQIDPDYRFIEEEIIVWAEQNLAVPSENNRRRLCICVYEYDSQRSDLLEKRGYVRTGNVEVTRRLCFNNSPIPKSKLAEGYTLRPTRPNDTSDCQRIADLLNAAFNRNFHVADEFRSFAKHASCFRNDSDLVAVAPDGTFAAYVGTPYDDFNTCGIFEPVCTHPDHQRKGLARSLMLEALQRLKDIGASEVLVGTGEKMAANLLYESVGFTGVYRATQWSKVI